jgi:hypothetical protein
MKTTRKRTFKAIAAIFGIIALTIIGCKQEPTPVAQSRDITIATGKTVTVNFTALPGTTPAWWNTLVSVFDDRKVAFDPGHYILNVQSTGTAGFAASGVGTKTVTVSEAFLSASDFTAMRNSMGPIVSAWIA